MRLLVSHGQLLIPWRDFPEAPPVVGEQKCYSIFVFIMCVSDIFCLRDLPRINTLITKGDLYLEARVKKKYY